MRSNGAYVADLILLIVASDEGVQSQTKESYLLAKESEIPVIITLNKIDLPSANVPKVTKQLQKLGWLPRLKNAEQKEDLGASSSSLVKGVVEISAKERMNLDVLVKKLYDTCKSMNLWEDTKCYPQATVVEVFTEDGGRGRVLRVLVHCGILEVGQYFVVGYETGRVKSIYNGDGKSIERALPGDPVEVVGLYKGTMPAPGDDLFVVKREKAEEVKEFRNLIAEFQGTEAKYDDALVRSIEKDIGRIPGVDEEEEEDEGEEESQAKEEEEAEEEEEEPSLQVVIKADNIGSLHTLIDACNELSEQNGIKVNVIRAGVGSVNMTDVAYAESAGCAIYCFNVKVNFDVRAKLKNKKATVIKHFDVFYHMLDDLKREQENILPSNKEQAVE